MACVYVPAVCLAPLYSRIVLASAGAIGLHLAFFVPIAFYCAKVLRDYLVKRNSRLLFEKYLSPFSFIVLCAALILLSAPWRNNFLYGQINPYLLALILYDLLRPGTRIPRVFLLVLLRALNLLRSP